MSQLKSTEWEEVLTTKKKYVAFISYSRKNYREMSILRNGLQKFRFPMDKVELENRPEGPFIRPVVNDGGVLDPDENFMNQIYQKIDQSRFLIVMCSREAVQSSVINDEVKYFLETRKESAINYIIPVLVNGTPNAKDEKDECLPQPLKEKYGEKIAKWNLPNMKPSPGQSPTYARECAIVLTAAYILRVSREAIYDEFQDQKRKMLRRRLKIVSALSVLFMVLTALACYYWRMASIARELEQMAKNEAIVTLSVSDFQEASRLIDDQQNIPDALVWLGGSLTDHYCTPAAQRLYELLAQRSWLVDRGKVAPEEFQKSTDEAEKNGMEMLATVRNFHVEKGNFNDITKQTTWKITLPKDGGTFEILAHNEPEMIPSPNGEYLYVVYNPDQGDYYIQLRSISENRVLKERKFHSGYTVRRFLSPDGIHLVFICISNIPDQENNVLVLDSYSLTPVLDIPTGMYFTDIAFSHDSRLLAVLQNSKKLQVFDLWKRKPFTEIKILNEIRGYVFFSENDRNVLVGNKEKANRFEIQTSPLAPREFLIETGNLQGCTLIPGTEQLLLWSNVYDLNAWVSSYDFATGTSVPQKKLMVKIGESEFPCSFSEIFAQPVLFNHQTRLGLIVEVEGEPKWVTFKVSPDCITDFKTWKQETVLDLPCMFEQAHVSSDSRYLVFAESIGDNTSPLKMFDLVTNNWVNEIHSTKIVMDVSFDTTNKTLYVSCIGGVTVWRKTGETWHTDDFSKHPELQSVLKDTWRYICVSSHGKLGLAHKSHCALVDLTNKKVLLDERTHAPSVNSTPCCFSDDGTLIAFAISSNEAIVYDAQSGRPITSVLEHPYEIESMRILTVGDQRILCCNASSSVKIKQGTEYRGIPVLWDINTKRRIIDHIPINEKIIFIKPVSVDMPKLIYASNKKVLLTDVLDVKEPKMTEERDILRQLLPLLCYKYGGGILNSWRAPEFDNKGTEIFETFCRTLTEEQKRLSQVKKWLEIDMWVSLPLEQRTVAPGIEKPLSPWLEQFAESEPQRCLEINPCMPNALCAWISSQCNKIAKKDYVYGLDNEKKFSQTTSDREQKFSERKISNPTIIYSNPRVCYFAEYMSRIAYERCPDNKMILKMRIEILNTLGKKEEAKQLVQKFLELN